MDRIGGIDHSRQFFDRVARFIANPVEILGIRKLAEHVCHIPGHVRIVQAQLALITVADCLLKEWFERMRLSLHTHLLRPLVRPVCSTQSSGFSTFWSFRAVQSDGFGIR